MPRKDLEQFLKERLTALDPTRDVSANSRADTEVIQPVLRYFGADMFQTDVRSFTLDTIRSVHPELNLQPDGIGDDHVAKPFATLAFSVIREIMLMKQRIRPDPRIHTLDSARELLGTLFVPVVEGTRAFGRARLYYSTPVSEVVRPENLIFARNGLKFVPTSTFYISKEEMQLNYEDGRYYFDVDVICSEPGVAGSIPVNYLDRAPSITRAIGVTNKTGFVGGTDADTTSSFLSRARNYPTQLSASVNRGIRAIIDSEYPGQTFRVEIAGMGDAEMLRDIIRGGSFGPALQYGLQGQPIPSLSPSLHSDLIDLVDGDLSSYGVGTLAEHYWLILHTPSSPAALYESRITEVLSSLRLRTETPIAPLMTSDNLLWEIRRKVITLSDIPGGILFPSPEGTIEIRDDEIHAGDATDIYLLSDNSQNETTIDIISDEDYVASGENSRMGGSALWGTPTQEAAGWIRLDAVEQVLLSGTVNSVCADYGGTGNKAITISTATKGAVDLSNVRVGLGEGELYDPTSPYSDVIEITISGIRRRYALRRLWVENVGNYFVFDLDRATVPGSGYSVRILRVAPAGIERGSSMLAIREPTVERYRVLNWSHGFDQGTETDPENYRFEVQVYPVPSVYPSGDAWDLIDDVDVDLGEPKAIRTSGTDLEISSGSTLVKTTSSKDFQSYNVKDGDIVRILTGANQGDHLVDGDPSGPGHALLVLKDSMTADGAFSYQIFSAQTPIDLPLVDVMNVYLISETSPGEVSSEVPLARPFGATSSQFANAGIGLKWRRTDAVTGIAGVAGINAFPGSFTFSSPNRFELRVRSRMWGEFTVLYTSGGPYDLTTAAGVQAFLARLNQNLPADYFILLDDNNQLISPASLSDPIPWLYLAVSPFDANDDFPTPGIRLKAENDAVPVLMGLGASATEIELTSRTVIFPSLDEEELNRRAAVSAWNDGVQVETGLNHDVSALIQTYEIIDDNLHTTLFPGTSFLPQRTMVARIGSPSLGLGRTYFRDPTLFSVDRRTKYTVGGQTFSPDPRLEEQISPAYPETDRPYGLYRDDPYLMVVPDDYAKYGILPNDVIEPSVRLIWFTWDFNPAPGGDDDWVIASAKDFQFVFEDGPIVQFSVPAGTYTVTDLVTLFNDELGEDMASEETIGGEKYLALRTQRRILSVSGTGVAALQGGGKPSAMDPDTYGTDGNLSKLAQQEERLVVVQTGNLSRVIFVADVDPSLGEDAAYYEVQFRVLRPGTQRFSAKKLSERVHASGLYYADVELISDGIGNEWNIAPDLTMVVTGYESLGYYVEPENEVRSLSMSERPWMRITPFIQSPLVDDDYDGQEGIYGLGLKLTYLRNPLVADVQLLLSSDDQRENNESILVRSMRPCEVFMGVNYIGGPDEENVRTELETLIEQQQSVLDVSTIITKLLQLGATEVQLPIEIAVAYMNQDRTYSFTLAKDRVMVSRLAGFAVGNLQITRVG